MDYGDSEPVDEPEVIREEAKRDILNTFEYPPDWEDAGADVDPLARIFKGKTGFLKPFRSFLSGEIKKFAAHHLERSQPRIYSFGERGSGFRHRPGESKTGPQDFEKIRSRCLEQGILFEDADFPADSASVFYSKVPPRKFEWKRPGELVENPRFFVGGASRFDICQGELGDCWLLAAVANLTLCDDLFYMVVPKDNSFVENYAGVFHFRFWQYGKWIDIVIDDRLPTYYDKLVFMHSAEQNEFWSALLEKAYAKLHGSYEALKGGTTCEAMEDFTGGLQEIYELETAPTNLFKIMLKAHEKHSLLGCSIEPDPHITEAELPNGLIRGHAYSITDIKLVDIQTPRLTGKIPLLRIRNPWGNEAEWKGPWSDNSPQWKYIPGDQREQLGLTFSADGEFWMAYTDFKKEFQRMEVCNLGPEALEDEGGHKWEMNVYEGAWTKGVTAGGCRNFLDTFWVNPQYQVVLEQPDDPDPDDDDDESGKCTIIIALMQKNRRAMKKMGQDLLTIGFAIYKLDDPDSLPKPLDRDFFKYHQSAARPPAFINLREVCARFKLDPGTYCVVPSSFEPNQEAEFILRIFSEKRAEMKEHDDEIQIKDPEEDDRPEPDDDRKGAVYEAFKRISGEDMEVDAEELRDVLNVALKKEFEFEGFRPDVCRSMVAMMDLDRSGKLGYEEFLDLWKSILQWKNVFRTHDKDNSGNLSTFELRDALREAGYHLNWHILQSLVLRYGHKDGYITFDDFILCAVRVKQMVGLFRDRAEGSKAAFTLEEWLSATMYS